MNKIRIKYLLRMSVFIILTIGGMTLIYNFFAEDFFISVNKSIMNDIYGKIKEMNITSISGDDEDTLDEYGEQGFNIVINNINEKKYTTYRGRREGVEVDKLMWQNINKYTENAKAQLSSNENAIKLRGKISQQGKNYFVFISIKIKTLNNTVKIMSKFLLVEMIIILIIGIPFSIYMANKTIKPIEKIGEMAHKMGNNQYFREDDYNFPNDEIGELADRIRKMYNQITRNINELNNYNYLLQIQNRDLIEFDERRKEFISMATHELKTPLAIVSSQVEMLNLDNSEIMSEYYDSIMEEIQKMSNLIRDMLKASFDDKLISNVNLKRGNLSKLIQSMQDKYEIWMDSKNITTKFNIEDNIYIKMNEEQIKQAFNNYIINAYEHTKKGGNVIVSLKKVQQIAILSVYNDGSSIEEDRLDKIWERFYHERKPNETANVGLGLYIVNDIVKYHDAVRYARNVPGGVEFVIEFKICQ